jgi:hypothetical protein
VEAAQPVTGRKTLRLGPAVETTAGQPLAVAARRTLLPATEHADAQRLLIPGRADTAEERTTARPVVWTKRAPLGPTVMVGAVRPVGSRKRLALGAAGEATAAWPTVSVKERMLGAAAASDTAGQLGAVRRVRLGVTAETARALIGPKIRLTWAANRDEARPLTGQRQRPADQLDATTSGPALTASSSGPSLTTNSSGPHLVASSTQGG